MKKNLIWCYLLLKRLIKNPAILLLLIGMPVAALLLSRIPAIKEESVPKVVIYAEDQDQTSVETIKRLVGGEYYAEFYETDSLEQMKQDILNGKAECGYLFRNGLTEKLDSKNCKDSILLIQDSSGMFTTMMNEIVFSALYQTYGQKIATNYVEQSPLFQAISSRAVKLTNQNYERYLEGTDTFYLEFEEIDSERNTTDPVESQVVFPVRGVLALLVFLAGLTGGVMWKIDQENGVLTAMPYHFRIFGRIWYVLVPTILFAASAELTLMVTQTAFFPVEILKMFLYTVSIVIFTTILSFIMRKSNTMMAVVMVLLIAGLLLCPVFIDLSSVLPGSIYFSRLLLPFYYLS